MRNIFLITMLFGFISCSNETAIFGKWESSKLITKVGQETISLNISKGDFRYSIWEFNADGNLLMGNYKVLYKIHHDTINITAEDGTVSVVPIVKLRNNELRLKELTGDSVIAVFRRLN